MTMLIDNKMPDGLRVETELVPFLKVWFSSGKHTYLLNWQKKKTFKQGMGIFFESGKSFFRGTPCMQGATSAVLSSKLRPVAVNK